MSHNGNLTYRPKVLQRPASGLLQVCLRHWHVNPSVLSLLPLGTHSLLLSSTPWSECLWTNSSLLFKQTRAVFLFHPVPSCASCTPSVSHSESLRPTLLCVSGSVCLLLACNPANEKNLPTRQDTKLDVFSVCWNCTAIIAFTAFLTLKGSVLNSVKAT